jgi:hypothetical protein
MNGQRMLVSLKEVLNTQKARPTEPQPNKRSLTSHVKKLMPQTFILAGLLGQSRQSLLHHRKKFREWCFGFHFEIFLAVFRTEKATVTKKSKVSGSNYFGCTTPRVVQYHQQLTACENIPKCAAPAY